jgi:hypothetical protein
VFIVEWELDCGILSRRNVGFNVLIINKLGILQCTLYPYSIAHYIQHDVPVSALLATKSHLQHMYQKHT